MNKFLPIIVILFALGSTGCSTIGYYSQSVSGHLSLWWQAEDIDDLLADGASPPELKARLRQVQGIRAFASQKLGLPDNGSYREYTRVEGRAVVWNVFAAEEFSVQAHRWCYPVVGCVGYRGYYDENEAREFATGFAAQGYDTHVGGVPAYSTLGWFDDPVPSTVIHWPPAQLAGLIFHELSHQVLYIGGDADFNEAFATAVQHLGVIQWLRQEHTPEDVEDYRIYLQRAGDFRRLLRQTRSELAELYASELSVTQMRQHKQAVFTGLRQRYAELKQSWQGDTRFDGWFREPLNNARLTATMTYVEKVPAFYVLFQQAGGNWARFYAAVREFDDMTQEQRDRRVEQLLAQAPGIEEITAYLPE